MRFPVKLRSDVGKWLGKSPWRLYPLFLLLMVLPVAFFANYVGRVLSRQTETQAVTESTQIARLSAALVADHFGQSTAFLQSIAVRPTFRKAWAERDLQLVRRQLEQASALRPDFAFVSVYDLDGTMRAIYPSQSGLLQQNFAYRDWYKGVAREWKPYVSEVYQTAVAHHQLVVAVAAPITNDGGKPVGILMAPIALDTMSRELVQTNLEGAWIISLVDQHGHLSARPNIDSYSPAIDLSGYRPVQEMLAGNAAQGAFVRDGNTFFARYQPVPLYGWGILVEQPAAVLHQHARAVEQRVWLLALV